jgi:tRNA pseudouridine38-40 synthase
MRFVLEIAYKGTGYHGWQKQPGVISVQATIEEKLSLLLGVETEILGCGRTDTGVHARQYFAQFDHYNGLSGDILTTRLNKMLPHDIAIKGVYEVSPDFHARFDAVERTYEYAIVQKPDPFLDEFAWYVYGPLDIAVMNHCAELLLSHKDFECFSKVHTDVKTFLCDVTYAAWTHYPDRLVFTIKANRFLRNMVRAIVGTLLEAGRGKLSMHDFAAILASRNRSEAGQSVPAKGLCLTGISYGPSFDMIFGQAHGK